MKYHKVKANLIDKRNEIKIKVTTNKFIANGIQINQFISLEEIEKLDSKLYEQLIIIFIAEAIVESNASIRDINKIYQDFINYKNNNPESLLLPEFKENLKYIEGSISSYEYDKIKGGSSGHIVPINGKCNNENSNTIKVNKELLDPKITSERVAKNCQETSSEVETVSEKSVQQISDHFTPDSPTLKAYSSLKKSGEKIMVAAEKVFSSVLPDPGQTTEKSWVAFLSSCVYGTGGVSPNSDSENDDNLGEGFVLMGQISNNTENSPGTSTDAQG